MKGVHQKETDDVMELVAVFDTIIHESFFFNDMENSVDIYLFWLNIGRSFWRR